MLLGRKETSVNRRSFIMKQNRWQGFERGQCGTPEHGADTSGDPENVIKRQLGLVTRARSDRGKFQHVQISVCLFTDNGILLI